MAWDPEDGTPRIPSPGGAASQASILIDQQRAIRQQQRQMLDRNSSTRTAGVLDAVNSYGPDTDTSHAFTFELGSGVWVANVQAVGTVEVSPGPLGAEAFLGVQFTDGARSWSIGPRFVRLTTPDAGNASEFTMVKVTSGELTVTPSLNDISGGTADITFEVTVSATQIA